MTVEVALPEEEDKFRDAITDHIRAQLGSITDDKGQALATHYLPGRVFAMHVLPQHFNVNSENIRRYIVSRPVVSSSSIIGRGTRGYWVLDTSTNSVVFIKDTWRFVALEELEGDILRRLVDLGVRNVPHMVWHGDVPRNFLDEMRPMTSESHRHLFAAPWCSWSTDDEMQQTRTQDQLLELSSDWMCRGSVVDAQVSLRQHYRLVMGIAGYPLNNVRGANELLHATYDVFAGMCFTQ